MSREASRPGDRRIYAEFLQALELVVVESEGTGNAVVAHQFGEEFHHDAGLPFVRMTVPLLAGLHHRVIHLEGNPAVIDHVVLLLLQHREAQRVQQRGVPPVGIHQDNLLEAVARDFIAHRLQKIQNQREGQRDRARMLTCLRNGAKIVFREDHRRLTGRRPDAQFVR